MNFREYINEMDLGKASKKMNKGNPKDFSKIEKSLKKYNSDDAWFAVLNYKDKVLTVTYHTAEKDEKLAKELHKKTTKIITKEGYNLKGCDYHQGLDKTGYAYDCEYTE